MANTLYREYLQSLLAGDADSDLDTDTAQDGVYCSLCDTGTTAYSTAHDFYNDVSGAAQGTDQRITTPTVADGTFDGDNLTYTTVSGNSVEALILYRHNAGANTTWRLVMFEDTGVTGLPVTPNGGNITVTWNGSGIFKLGTFA